ncbi:MAG: NADP-dependent oxidoreductase [Gammaproteobacteria bacterium]|jgi:NADPH-dependent curcumin reductase CurA|nr:NADP-dependent oxidoreductase [Gammaproteobacteria bacterium]MBT5205021.1 NADP-dependent oxidoreductase [Gammaproteobacteria bacterium]MBT5602180.1 NADP-dependent oxidoreductase [Gammaproteobacteria bacterium]MBT6246143.1 NADP-dependent oxidoreductase [Gammaproteobacteria bacterium]
MKNQQILIDQLPSGKLSADNYRLEENEIGRPEAGEVLVKTEAFAIAAGSRAGLQGSASYAGAPTTGIVMGGTGVGIVVESTDAQFSEGDKVVCPTGWQRYSMQKARAVEKIPAERSSIHYLGPLGVNGLTAYFGLLEIGQPEAGETVMISAAAGSVGHLAGQIAKIKGCQVVGIAGQDHKCKLLTDQLGFDAAVNYKQADYRGALKELTPNGVDVYFDNTGGFVLGSALFRLNLNGRIVCCGVVSQYDTASPEPGPKGIPGLLVNKRIRMQGFLVFDFLEQYAAARAEISGWLDAGQLTSMVDEIRGIESAPAAFVDLLAGGNLGTRVVFLD